MKKLARLFLLGLSCGTCFAQTVTVSYATADDVRSHAVKCMNDLRDGTRWGNINQDCLDLFNTYMSFVEGGQAREEQRFVVLEARTKANEDWRDGISPKLDGVQKETDQAASDAANAIALAQQLIDAHPCDVLNFKFAQNELNVWTFSFTTPRPCSATISGGYNYGSAIPNFQASRGSCSTQGTITGSFDSTLKTSFTWALPIGWPAHGCVVAKTYDQYGNATPPRQFVY